MVITNKKKKIKNTKGSGTTSPSHWKSKAKEEEEEYNVLLTLVLHLSSILTKALYWQPGAEPEGARGGTCPLWLLKHPCICISPETLRKKEKEKKKGHPLESDPRKRKEEKVILKDQTM